MASKNHSYCVWKRYLSFQILPNCSTKLEYFITFVGLFLALSFLTLVSYAIISALAYIMLYMMEHIWPAVIFISLASLGIFLSRYNLIAPDEEDITE